MIPKYWKEYIIKKANLVNIKNISLYKKYEKKIINNIINHVRNNVLMCTKTFKFAGKPAYITIIDKHAFTDTGIEHKMIDEKNNIILIIKDMAESFFDRYVQKHKTDNAQVTIIKLRIIYHEWKIFDVRLYCHFLIFYGSVNYD